MKSKPGEVFPNKACYTPSTCKKDEENPCSKKNYDSPHGTNGKNGGESHLTSEKGELACGNSLSATWCRWMAITKGRRGISTHSSTISTKITQGTSTLMTIILNGCVPPIPCC